MVERRQIKISPWNFGKSSGGGQSPEQAFNTTVARKTAEKPFDLAKEERERSPEVQDFEIKSHLRKKASEDAIKTSSVLPLLDDLENSYREAYADIIGQEGLKGGVAAAKEYGIGVLLRKNRALRTLQGKLKTYRPAFVRASGDSGNFSVVEQEAAGEGLPKLTPNWDINNLFLPDDPVQGLARIQGMRDLYKKKYDEQVRVANTGEYAGTGYESNLQKKNDWITPKNSQGPDMDIDFLRQQAIDSIKSGKGSPDKVKAKFKSYTGQEL